MSKLGFGFMRLPLTDPKDAASIDIPLLTKMVDLCLVATIILTPLFATAISPVNRH
jgi:predicted aldo/keto reductase-like oxidoreductase